ncbi:MAG TPA: cyclodeaminase/cyclohydrolase family protein [Solirubrobacteraceae bacterium]|nr:cyclodeaminase/cyclohydrolase family protein [Solirubrobacteraceae bacterium]
MLDRVAAPTPAPGGGSASAMASALAAGLVQMAAGFGDAGLRDAGIRAAQLRERALELATGDLHSYEPVLVALRLPAVDPDRQQRLARARSDASRTPLEIAELAAEVAELGARSAREGSTYLDGDATTAVLLAEASCRAAVRLVEINLAGAAGDGRLARARELALEAASAREQTLAGQPGSGPSSQ